MNEQDLHFQRAALTEVAAYRNARSIDRVVVNGGWNWLSGCVR